MSNHVISTIFLRIKPPYKLDVNKGKTMLTLHSAEKSHTSLVYFHGTGEALAGFAYKILKALGYDTPLVGNESKGMTHGGVQRVLPHADACTHRFTSSITGICFSCGYEEPPDELVYDEPPVCDMCGGQGWFVPETHLGGNPYQYGCPQCGEEGVMPDVGGE